MNAERFSVLIDHSGLRRSLAPQGAQTPGINPRIVDVMPTDRDQLRQKADLDHLRRKAEACLRLAEIADTEGDPVRKALWLSCADYWEALVTEAAKPAWKQK